MAHPLWEPALDLGDQHLSRDRPDMSCDGASEDSNVKGRARITVVVVLGLESLGVDATVAQVIPGRLVLEDPGQLAFERRPVGYAGLPAYPRNGCCMYLATFLFVGVSSLTEPARVIARASANQSAVRINSSTAIKQAAAEINRRATLAPARMVACREITKEA